MASRIEALQRFRALRGNYPEPSGTSTRFEISGAALAVAADMSRTGRHTVMDELDGERVGLKPVRATGTTIAIGKITMAAAIVSAIVATRT